MPHILPGESCAGITETQDTRCVDITVQTVGGVSGIWSADQYTYVVQPKVYGIGPVASGPTTGGTTFNIYGSGLAGVNKVTLDGSRFVPNIGTYQLSQGSPTTPGQFADISSLVITVTTPAVSGPGLVDTTVSNPFYTSAKLGTANSSPDTFDFVTPPPPPPPVPVKSTRGSGSPSTKKPYCHKTSHQVNCLTGEQYTSSNDLSVPGRGLGLAWSRTYGSMLAAPPSLSTGGQPITADAPLYGPLGYGWTDSYNMYLSVDTTACGLASSAVSLGNVGTTTCDVAVAEEGGSTINFTANGSGNFTAPSQTFATLAQNLDGSWTFVRERQYTFGFNANGQLTSESDLNGYVTSLSYDSAHRLAVVTDPSGRSLVLSYNTSNLIAMVTDPSGRSVSYAYDSSGDLTSVTNTNGGLTTYTYDTSHRLVSECDPNCQKSGHPVTTVYYQDGSSRVQSQTDAMGYKTTFQYSGDNFAPDDGNLAATGGTTTITDPRGMVEVQNYSNGELTSMTDAYGTAEAATWSYTYDPVTLGVIQETDPNGNITTAAYDANGDEIASTDGLGNTSTMSYNALGEPTQIDQAGGQVTTYVYDSNGNIKSVSKENADQPETTQYIYGDPTHPADITSIVDPMGETSNLTYDAYGDVASFENPLGDTTSFTYNNIGETRTSTSPTGAVTSYTYDGFGDQILATGPTGSTSNTYDQDANLLTTTDPNAHTTSYAYDLNNQLTKTTGPDGSTTSYTYDQNGNELTSTDANSNTTTYGYNELNRLSLVTSPAGEVTTYTYDAAGHLVLVSAPTGVTTTYKVNAAGETEKVSYSDSTAPVSYQYSASGQVTSMADGTGTTTYGYDQVGHLINQSSTTGANVSYSYDANGDTTQITYPNKTSVSYGYDQAGQLKSATDWNGNAYGFTYDSNGNLKAIAYPNGTNQASAFNAAGQLTSIVDSKGQSNLAGFSYTQDPAGLILTSTSTSSMSTPQASQSYSYNSVNELVSAGSQSFSYDKAGNLTSMPAVTKMAYNADSQLTSATTPSGPTTYTYDSNGNRTSGSGSNYTYNAANELTSISTSTTSAIYTYAGDGLRTSATTTTSPSSGSTTPTVTNSTFAWDRATSSPQLLSDGTYEFLYGPNGVPIEQVCVATGAVTYLYEDQLGSIVMMTDSSGNVTGTRSYSAYGQVSSSTGTAVSPLGFTGAYSDPTGLLYLVNRYMDPATGQFLTVDPLTALTGQPYAYAGGDPTNFVDPLGLSCGGTTQTFFDTFDPLSNCNYFRQSAEHGGWWGRHAGINPAYQTINHGYNAYELAQNPCSSNWSIAGQAAESAGYAAATVGVGVAGAGAVSALGGDTAENGVTAAVIGRQADTAPFEGASGYEVLNVPNWTPDVNDAWVQSVIGRDLPVYVASPLTWENLYVAEEGRATVFAIEMNQFLDAGYSWEGNYLVPPKG